MADHEFFHGTRRPFMRGGLLLPRAAHGGAGTSAPLTPGMAAPADAEAWAYVTTDLDLAWVYAFHAPGRGRARVIRLRSITDLERDIEHSTSMNAFRCKSAIVDAVLTEPTVTEEDARAGWVL